MTTLADALAPKSDQLNADDLIAGPRVLKITGARVAKDGRDIRIVLNYEGDNGKPWKPCKTMGRAMVMAWKIETEDQLVGKSVRVFRDPTVRFGDQGEVGGIRISHMSHLDRVVKVKLTVSQGKKSEFTFNPLVTEAPAKSGPTAEEWADGFIARLDGLMNVDGVAAHEASNAKALARIEKNHPELHQRIRAAVDAKIAFVSGEKRDDADMGEGFTGERTQ